MRLFIAKFSIEPSPSEGPKTVGFPAADPHGLGSFALRKSEKEAEGHQLRGLRAVALELFEDIIEGQDLLGARIHDGESLVEIDLAAPGPVFGSSLATGPLDKNPPHGLRCCGKEMTAGIPMLRLLDIH